jgi:AcrR family transcriptional regulator
LQKERKLQIIRAALKRFVKHGLKKTTLDEVARDLRIGKATLYHYFNSKEDLYYQTLQYEITQYLNEIKSAFEKQEANFSEQLIEFIHVKENLQVRYRLIYQLMLRILEDEEFSNEKEIFIGLLEEERKLVEDFLNKNIIIKEYSAEEILQIITSYCWGVTFNQKFQAGEKTVNTRHIIGELLSKKL